MNAAVSGDEVWVTTGLYVGCITLNDSVALYGGFAGNEADRQQRNWSAHVTILDGNEAGSVVTSPINAVSTARIDGFTIRYSNSSGCGIKCLYSSFLVIANNTITGCYFGVGCYTSNPTITNTTIRDNSGYGIYCEYSSPLITGNIISQNAHGGIGSSYSSPVVTNNRITRNPTSGIYCSYSDPALGKGPTIINNEITENSGNGIYCSCCSPSIINNTICGNAIGSGGGGIECSDSSSPTIKNNIIAFNSSGIYVADGVPTLASNCVYNPDRYNYHGTEPGTGDMQVAPKLYAVAYGKFQIRPDSPCRDAGDDSVVQSGWLDVDGQARMQGSHVDLGADESDGSTPAFTPAIVRVGVSGDDANDGSSWILAKKTVQAGIDAAAVSGGEVWVAAGTYDERINLGLHTYIYGGFAGVESARDQRNPSSNVTILDGGAAGSVVNSTVPGYATAGIDGFTITNGTATDGAGIFCYLSSPTIANNTIKGNNGSGIYGSGSASKIANNRIASSSGAGLRCSNCSCFVIGNTIAGNGGSGLMCYDYSSDSVYVDNTITGSGAYGIDCYRSSPDLISNTVSANNYGGIYCWADSYYSPCSPLIENNTVVDNTGDGILTYEFSAPMIANNIVARNLSGIKNVGSWTPTLINNCVYNPNRANYQDIEHGAGDIQVDPKLCMVSYGKFHIQPDSPCRDAGDDSMVEPGWLDMDGQPRVQEAHVDIGADESDGSVCSFSPAVVRVSLSGNDANDGSTWVLAKRTVQAGIDAAAVDGGEVWIAAGTYNERINLGFHAFVFGGFAGVETARDERNWFANATILDGGAADSVVRSTVPGYGTAGIDGFTIRNGTAADGAGIYCYLSSPNIANNTVTANSGSGIYCGEASPLIKRNSVTGNTGCGIYCSSNCSTVTDNTISGNGNGGMLVAVGDTLITNNVISGNYTSSYGGGIYCSGTDAKITNNTIVGNAASCGGGGIAWRRASSHWISNNIIAFNTSGVYGLGGAYVLRNNCVYNPGDREYYGLSAGDGDFCADPMLADLRSGDHHLAWCSPCKDAGWNDAPGLSLADKDGNSRILGASVDMGAYEYSGPSLARTISATKETPDDELVGIIGGIVTAVSVNLFYISTDDRISGIRVEKESHGLTEGMMVMVAGYPRTDLDGERYIEATDIRDAGTGTVAPLGLTNRALGGSDSLFNAITGLGQRGVTGGVGLNNIGLLVRTTGACTYVNSQTFAIDDGSGVIVTCETPPTIPTDPTWASVAVSGISSMRKVDGVYKRILKVTAVEPLAFIAPESATEP